jgi:zinc transporter ZupT
MLQPYMHSGFHALFGQVPVTIWCALLAAAATFLGAMIARALQRRTVSALVPWAFSGGSLVSLAVLDLIPESLSLNAHLINPIWIMALLVLAGFGYALLSRLRQATAERSSHSSAQSEAPVATGSINWRGSLLVLHSVIDGIAIGIGFSASLSLGWLMAIAVIAHDVSDGFNTIVMVRGRHAHQPVHGAWIWANVAAPPLGAALTLSLQPSGLIIAFLLAMLAGVFLAISLGEVLPAIWVQPRPIKALSAYLLGAILMGGLLLSLGS